MSKCKRWVFTSYAVDSPPAFDAAVHEYLIIGRETCPTSNRKHLQCFVTFKNRTTLAGCKRFCPGAHFERARGTPEECASYSKKDGDFSEFGTLPTVTGRATGFADLLAKAQRGEIGAIKRDHPGLYIRYKANILSSIEFDVSPLKNSCGVWIGGKPRTGKDYGVRQLAGEDLYLKPLSKWWCNYRNQGAVLLSDVDPKHCEWLGYFLKIWADCYPFNAEIKGGSMTIRPKAIFVTSNYPMDMCFQGETLAALQARFTEYDYFGEEIRLVRKRMEPSATSSVYQFLLENEDAYKPLSPPLAPEVQRDRSPQRIADPPDDQEASAERSSEDDFQIN